ncbi:MAG: succinylglutamate desuccinylase/aspartoacylase family protein [Lewinella sp.]|uniref:succinylglutamate desuccinylase/aspartoacylase family protein n=1 Tax=Lewinella sp. TaxID=2004506 RepID=UPI003D6BEC3F
MLMPTMQDNLPMILDFNLEDTPRGTKRNYWLKIISDGFANPICIPVMVARGLKDGPVLGLTAAVHGNELNGIPVIQRLFNEVEIEELSGTIVGVPVVNVPSFIRKSRRFNDGVDLNHIMPGKESGNVSQVYAYRFIDRLVKHFDYLLDLHTASQGRVNSYYIRADMDHPVVNKLAMLQNADIIVHNPASDGTLRGAVAEMDIPAITLEVGNPNTFQKRLIRSGITGIHNVLCHLKMVDDEIEIPAKPTVLCKSSFWIYTDVGGLLTVWVDLREEVKKGQLIATIRDIFGHKIKDYLAPSDGIVIGKSVSPVNQTGGRILHLGIHK